MIMRFLAGSLWITSRFSSLRYAGVDGMASGLLWLPFDGAF